MGKKTNEKKEFEKERNKNKKPSSLMEASHSKNGAKFHDEDKTNHDSRHEISGNGIEFEASQNEAPIEVDVSVEKEKKKKKRKGHETSGDDVELSACKIEPVKKDNVNGGDIIKKKKKEKRRENAGNDIDSSIRQCEVGRESNIDKDDVDVDMEKKKKKKKKEHETSGDGVELSASKVEPLRKDNVDDEVIKKKKKRRENGGNDINSSIKQCEAGRKSNVHKDKRKKKNKKLQEDSGYNADQNNVVESDGHVDKKKKSEDNQMNEEEVDGKKKKKRKRDKGGDDFTEVNNATDVEAGKDMEQAHEIVDGDVIKKKKRRENSGNDIDSSIKQCEAGRKSNVHKDNRKKKNKKLQEDSGYNADQNNVVESDGHVDKKKKSEDNQTNEEEVDGKKKKKRKRDKGGDDFTEVNNATDVEAGKDMEQTHEIVDGDVIKKKKRRENSGNDIDSSLKQCEAGRKSNVHKDNRKKKNKKLQEDSGYSADQNNVIVESDGHVVESEDRQINREEVDGKKKNKRKRDKVGDDFTEVNNATDVEAGKDMEQMHEKMMENVENPRKKKKRKKNHSEDVTTENHTWKDTRKKVSFSDDVEVFAAHEGLVHGKRYSPEEDEKIRKAVLSYIEFHKLGEDGQDMVLHSRSHPEVKNCWKEIAEALPWRPKKSVYHRAQFIFERDDNRRWSPEELKFVRIFYDKHGPDWRLLADTLGKHRWQVKDAWRRTKLLNRKRGSWSQEEIQNLFDLVNLDLRTRAFEERKSKHGMLRENISWEAISDKLATRPYAFCCIKWYYQLSSPLVVEGKWSDSDDYRLVNALYNLDACCIEDVCWDDLLEHRPGDICLKRWNQMVKHLGTYKNKSFPEQVEVLSRRYCPDVLEAREVYDSKPVVD